MNAREEDEITVALIELIESADRRADADETEDLFEMDRCIAETIRVLAQAVLDNWHHLRRVEPKTPKQGTKTLTQEENATTGLETALAGTETPEPILDACILCGSPTNIPRKNALFDPSHKDGPYCEACFIFWAKAQWGADLAPRQTKETPDLLQEALDWCAARGLVFDFVNANAPDRIAQYGADPRKVSADLYLDDRGLAREMFETYMLSNIEFYSGLLGPGDIIAVDFDGTLCRFDWPKIGEPNHQLIGMLLKAQRRGVRLTLWTCREHPASAKA